MRLVKKDNEDNLIELNFARPMESAENKESKSETTTTAAEMRCENGVCTLNWKPVRKKEEAA